MEESQPLAQLKLLQNSRSQMFILHEYFIVGGLVSKVGVCSSFITTTVQDESQVTPSHHQ